jgi:hypothetical protein
MGCKHSKEASENEDNARQEKLLNQSSATNDDKTADEISTDEENPGQRTDPEPAPPENYNCGSCFRSCCGSYCGNPRKYGEWKDHETCPCAKRKKRILNFKIKFCPIVSKCIKKASIVFGRKFKKKIAHSFVEFKYKCEVCNEKGYFTSGFGKKGIYIKFGKYEKSFENPDFDFNRNVNPNDLSYVIVNDINEELENRNKFTKNDFNIKKNNCQHFSKKLFESLIQELS